MSGIQGHPLEVTVVSCYNLEDVEWVRKQDPYVCIEYGTTKFKTQTHIDGGKNPSFKEKFTFTLVEGLRELSVTVWDYNTIRSDKFIGSGRIQLHNVLSHGFDDNTWSLQGCNGRHSGDVRVILHYSHAANSNGSGKQPEKNKIKPSNGAMNHHNMPYPQPPYTAPSPYATYPTMPPAGYPYPPPPGYPPQSYPPHPSAAYYPPAGPPTGFYPASPY